MLYKFSIDEYYVLVYDRPTHSSNDHLPDMPDPNHIPLRHPPRRQGRNDRGPDPAPVLRRPDIDAIRFSLGPIQNLPQGLRAASFEMRVPIEHRAVGADVEVLIAFLLRNGGDAAGREAGGARADEFGEAPAEFEFGFGGAEAEFGGEEVGGFGEVFVGVSVVGCVSLC